MLVLLFTGLLQSPTALAGEKPACISEAEQQYSMVDFEKALSTLTSCPDNVKTPEARACIHVSRGYNLMELERKEKARDAFREGLALDPDACGCSRAYKEQVISRCHAEQKTMKGVLVVRCKEPGAEVFIDGTVQGKAPLTRELIIGAYQVSVRKGERKSSPQKVNVLHRRKVTVTLYFPPPIQRVMVPPPDGKTPGHAGIPNSPRPQSKSGRLWTWVAGGLAVAAAGAATGVWFAGEGQHSDWEDIAAQEMVRALTADEEQDLADLQSAVEQKEVAAYALWGVAGAAAAAAVVLFFVEGGEWDESLGPHVTIFPMLGSANGVGARVDFD